MIQKGLIYRVHRGYYLLIYFYISVQNELTYVKIDLLIFLIAERAITDILVNY